MKREIGAIVLPTKRSQKEIKKKENSFSKTLNRVES